MTRMILFALLCATGQIIMLHIVLLIDGASQWYWGDMWFSAVIASVWAQYFNHKWNEYSGKEQTK
jgi:hypothetical protein